jgi:hypothetical protein
MLLISFICQICITQALGFIYAFALRIPGVLAFMVWASVFMSVAIFFVAGWYAGETATQWASADPPTFTEDEIKLATYGSYVLYAIGGLLVLLFLFMRKRIQLAMGCVKETSKAIITMPVIILFPVIQAIGFMVFMIVWSVYAVNVASMGEFSTYSVTAGPISISVSCFSFKPFCVLILISLMSLCIHSIIISGTNISVLRLCQTMRLVSPFLLLLVRSIHCCHGRDCFCNGRE